MNEAERAHLSELAEAIRLLARAGLIDHSGHGSVRRDAATFFINSAASVRSSLDESDFVAIDLSGGLVAGSTRPPLEFPLHAEIYRARADVRAILHTHPQWSTYLSMTNAGYVPVFAQGCLPGDVPTFDSVLSINSREMGQRVAATLGDGHAALLKSHGAVIVGTSVLECFALCVYLEENARRQYMAMQIGTPYVFTPEERVICRERLWSAALFQKAWEHYRAKPAGG